MVNLFQPDEIKEKGIEKTRPLHQSDLTPQIIKNRHIEGYIINVGTAANRPDGTTNVKAYWATDTGVLSIWNGSSWKSTTLS